MRISDWSSDVCSSDLASPITPPPMNASFTGMPRAGAKSGSPLRRFAHCRLRIGCDNHPRAFGNPVGRRASKHLAADQDRKSVVEGKSVSVGVDLGGRRFIKKKTLDDRTVV